VPSSKFSRDTDNFSMRASRTKDIDDYLLHILKEDARGNIGDVPVGTGDLLS